MDNMKKATKGLPESRHTTYSMGKGDRPVSTKDSLDVKNKAGVKPMFDRNGDPGGKSKSD